MLLVTDLDGTLLTSQKAVSPRTRQALIEFHQNGGLLAACSARPVSSMVRLLQQQEVDTLFGWYAGFNGGQILETTTHNIVHSAALSCMDLRDIDRHISLSNYSHHFFGTSAIYHRYDQTVASWTHYEAHLFELPLLRVASGNIFNRQDIYKITLVAEDECLNPLCLEISEKLPLGYTATITGKNYIDIQRTEVNKGYAVDRLITQLNIPSAQVAAIGDQQNDISMLTRAGVGIAMGNAPDNVKQQARYVTTTNDDEGIVCALEWLRCFAHPVTMRQSSTLAENNEPD
ncbi:Cof-type HAD-IIB family hydrolase [Kluyvera ascorbata]|uniref:Cof-type HAD-IIB family hydrolase n=1 Tax=Kluyvera ascorbata TaxID=51288 RepID=UPI0028DDE137|nr:Cof-type HAD-IIB family hydrolase [Kluyvera ascorbata]MDT8701785.1 Cof-type HAD-IIB family hydrolase [Kluyvera ascorbata]